MLITSSTRASSGSSNGLKLWSAGTWAPLPALDAGADAVDVGVVLEDGAELAAGVAADAGGLAEPAVEVSGVGFVGLAAGCDGVGDGAEDVGED